MSRWCALAFLTAIATACGDKPEDSTPHDSDADSDGYSVDQGDCNDNDPTVNPGVDETWYDGLDQNCDGWDDFDADGDGHESDDHDGDDCDDLDPAVNPSVDDAWYDGVDSDCGGNDDFDRDGDGHSSATYKGDDCDDGDSAINPGAAELYYDGVDQDCDGLSDYDADVDGYDSLDHGGADCDDVASEVNPSASETWYDGVDSDCAGDDDFDRDGDGYESDAFGGDDCDDGDASISPEASETYYDGTDQDCDGWSDFDADRDGYAAGEDCADDSAAINPGATELFYDGIDEDCDGLSDFDADADSFDSSAYGGSDCDDTDDTVHPGATDTYYDGIDQNCDLASDYDADADGYDSAVYDGDDCDDAIASTFPGAPDAFYDGVDSDCAGNNDFDADGDSYPSDAYGGLDCLDTDPLVHPSATEVWYDGVDSDCDGASDYDQDSDGDDADAWGGLDCNDADATINPAAVETCQNGVDDNCDGVGCRLEGASLESAALLLTGEPHEMAGYTVQALGDVNADGVDDFIVGAPSWESGTSTVGGLEGRVYIVEGPVTGKASLLDLASARIEGDDTNYAFGTFLGRNGDADGDGFADVVLNATATDRVDGFLSPLIGGVAVSAADFTVAGENEGGDMFGMSVSSMRDATDDGLSDLIIGAPGNHGGGCNYAGCGSAYVVVGPLSGDLDAASMPKIIGDWSSQDEFGHSVDWVGDVSGDGVLDFAVGIYWSSSSATAAGAAAVFDSIPTGVETIESAYAVFLGEEAGDTAGADVRGAGDATGDGIDDLVVTAPDSVGDHTGSVYLVSGAVSGSMSLDVAVARIDGYSNSFMYGLSVADLDTDGSVDIVVGAYGYDGYTGAAYVSYGPITGAVELATLPIFTGAAADDCTAQSITVADATGDGTPDLIVGASHLGVGGDDAGGVYLVPGVGL